MTTPRGSIILDDMHIRDERALEWISRQSRNGTIELKRGQLAKQLGCHENTATAILRRLIGAGMIEVSARRRRFYVYRVVSQQ